MKRFFRPAVVILILSALAIFVGWRLFLSGGGVVGPNVEAIRKLAAAGDMESSYTMGEMYRLGQGGVTQDMARAFEWYRLADQIGGSRDAEFAMAQMYFHGRGVARDYAEAFALYKKAAAKGHHIAQYLIGAMYEEGWAVKRDYVEAWKWYTLALAGRDQAIALNPLYDPRQALDRLEPRMNKAQIRRGRQRVKDWRFEHEDPFN